AGTSIARGVSERSVFSEESIVAISCPSTTDDVDDSENDDPDRIHEMPVQRQHVDTTGLIRTNTAGQTEQQRDQKHHKTGSHVKGMQADERVIGGTKEVGRNRQAVVVNQPVPLLRRAVHEETAQNYCEQPQPKEYAALSQPE